MIRRALFSDLGTAQSFLAAVQSKKFHTNGGPSAALFYGMRDGSGVFGLPHSRFEHLVNRYGGLTVYRSSDLREQYVYEMKPFIYPEDKVYLTVRDPTGERIVNMLPESMWRRFPIVRSAPAITKFFTVLSRLRFLDAARKAHMLARRDGAAFIYVDAGGAPSSPLRAGLALNGFTAIPLHGVSEAGTVFTNTSSDPGSVLETSRILTATITPLSQQEFEVHGDRLFPVTEDTFNEDALWQTISPLENSHDDLWALRDVLVTHRNSQIQANPFAVDVEVAEGMPGGTLVAPDKVGTADDPLVELDEEMRAYQGFGRDHFAPVENAGIKRVGPADLKIDENHMRAMMGRIAGIARSPIGKLFPVSRGSEQVGIEERMQWAEAVFTMSDIVAKPVYDWALDVGRALGFLRRADSFLPADYEWYDPLFYNGRERAYIINTHASAARTLIGSDVNKAPSLTLPPHLDEQFAPIHWPTPEEEDENFEADSNGKERKKKKKEDE